MKPIKWNNWKKPVSIRRRITVLTGLLLLIVITAFSFISYIGMKHSALEVGQERLRTLTVQLSSMFQQSVHTLEKDTRTVAQEDSIRHYLRADSSGSAAAAIVALQKLTKDSLSVLAQLWSAGHKSLLQTGKYGVNIPVRIDSLLLAASTGPDYSKAGRIYILGDSMYYPVAVAVTDDGKILGYVVKWRLLHATPQAIDRLSELIGTKARLYFANDDWKLWTDMIKPVPPPPILPGKKGTVIRYTRANNNRVLGFVQAIPGTRWLILLEFSRATVLQAANRFLYWIIVIGTLLATAGIIMAWLMSRNITRPLNRLTKAAIAIAGGDYSATVGINRRDELGQLARSFNTMAVQVQNAQLDLEKKISERTRQLETANKELEAFSYSVSHDLRAPLRAVNGYALMLKEDYAPRLDMEATRIIDTIVSNARMMGQLIDDLINFSRLGRKAMALDVIDMEMLARNCVEELLATEPEDKYRVAIASLPPSNGDAGTIKQVWINLLGNALKYSSKRPQPCIEISFQEEPTRYIYLVRDNGVGFDMKYQHKLFGVFQRLHGQEEFEGTGVGLALVKRIINRHNGEVWANAVPGKGATFYFTLPKNNEHEQ